MSFIYQDIIEIMH